MVTTRTKRIPAKQHQKTAKKSTVKADAKKKSKSEPKPSAKSTKKAVPQKKIAPPKKADKAKKAEVKKAAKKTVPAKRDITPKRSATPKKAEKKPVIKKVAKKAPAKDKKPEGSSYLGYTPSQYLQIKAIIEKLQDRTVAQLKQECRSNNTTMSGNKKDIIYRIAEGRILGAIPRCPECGGGRPKFDPKKGTYHCSGYMEDEDFINCHKNYTMSSLPRLPWTPS